MNILEFMDLYDLEPVVARLRLSELSFTFDDHQNLNIDQWTRFGKFSRSLSPTWLGILSLHSDLLLLDVNIKKLPIDAWDEILQINPKMFRHFQRIHPNIARSRAIDHRTKL
jgi:hypothetical protein